MSATHLLLSLRLRWFGPCAWWCLRGARSARQMKEGRSRGGAGGPPGGGAVRSFRERAQPTKTAVLGLWNSEQLLRPGHKSYAGQQARQGKQSIDTAFATPGLLMSQEGDAPLSPLPPALQTPLKPSSFGTSDLMPSHQHDFAARSDRSPSSDASQPRTDATS